MHLSKMRFFLYLISIIVTLVQFVKTEEESGVVFKKDNYVSEASAELTDMNEVIESDSIENDDDDDDDYDDDNTTQRVMTNDTSFQSLADVTTTPMTSNPTLTPTSNESVTSNSIDSTENKLDFKSSEEDPSKPTLSQTPQESVTSKSFDNTEKKSSLKSSEEDPSNPTSSPTPNESVTSKSIEYTEKNLSLKSSEEDPSNTTLSPTTHESVTSKSFECQGRKLSLKSSEEDPCTSTLVNYPYSASIQKKGAHYASGVLINHQSVLTAGGVFYNVRETIKLFKVRLGSVDCKRGGVVLPIKHVDVHPSYQSGQPSFDVAIITLSQPVEMTEYIKPIRLSSVTNNVIKAKFMTTYWPRLIVNGNVLPSTAKERVKQQSMRVSTQKLISWLTCASLLRARDATLDDTSLCLKPIVTHHSICMPDVGAPVIADDGLWGITSGWTSPQCSVYPSPTLVTRTAMPHVRSWLTSVLYRNSSTSVKNSENSDNTPPRRIYTVNLED